jgi:hypothetical protein
MEKRRQNIFDAPVTDTSLYLTKKGAEFLRPPRPQYGFVLIYTFITTKKDLCQENYLKLIGKNEGLF